MLCLTFKVSQAEEVMFHQTHVCDHHVQHVLTHSLHVTADLQLLTIQQHHKHLPQALLHLPTLILHTHTHIHTVEGPMTSPPIRPALSCRQAMQISVHYHDGRGNVQNHTRLSGHLRKLRAEKILQRQQDNTGM